MSAPPPVDPTPPPPATPATQTPAPPPPPGPDASREEWHDWRHKRRDYERAMWSRGGWYGGWGFGWPWFWGAVLVILGVYFLLSNLNLLNWLRGDIVWPVIIILFGVFLIVRRGSWWR